MVCVVFVSFASKKVETFIDKEYQNYFMKGMNQLRLNDEYTNVTLSSGDVHIRCHRVVLAVASDYLKAMFTCDLHESMSDSVQLKMEPETMVTIIDYIYTGEIELTVDNAEGLVKACDILQLDTLKTACENFMIKQVGPSNVVGFYKFAALYRLNQLQHKAMDLMKSEFNTVAFADEFKELSCTEVIEWIRQDDGYVEDEDVVMEAVLGWIKHDVVNRKSSLASVMEHVRLPFCSRAYLRHIKDDIELMSPKCSEYLHEALVFQADTVHQHEMSSGRTVPRTSYRMWSGKALSPVECVDVKRRQWSALPDLQQAVYRAMVATHANKVFVFGGRDGQNKNLCCTQIYDTTRGSWSSGSDTPDVCSLGAAVTLNDSIYVVGGGNRTRLKYHPASDTWTRLSPPQQEHRWAPAVVWRGSILVAGGGSPGERSSVVEVYDPLTDTWSVCSIASLIEKLTDHFMFNVDLHGV